MFTILSELYKNKQKKLPCPQHLVPLHVTAHMQKQQKKFSVMIKRQDYSF